MAPLRWGARESPGAASGDDGSRHRREAVRTPRRREGLSLATEETAGSPYTIHAPRTAGDRRGNPPWLPFIRTGGTGAGTGACPYAIIPKQTRPVLHAEGDEIRPGPRVVVASQTDRPAVMSFCVGFHFPNSRRGNPPWLPDAIPVPEHKFFWHGVMGDVMGDVASGRSQRPFPARHRGCSKRTIAGRSFIRSHRVSPAESGPRGIPLLLTFSVAPARRWNCQDTPEATSIISHIGSSFSLSRETSNSRAEPP